MGHASTTQVGLVAIVDKLPQPAAFLKALPLHIAGWWPPGLFVGLSLLGQGRTRKAYLIVQSLVVKIPKP